MTKDYVIEIFQTLRGRMTKTGTVTFPEVNEATVATVAALQAAGGMFIRLSWWLQVELVDAGAYGKTWQDLRAEVFQAIRDGEYGDLEEVGSSDVNHMIVGRLYGVPVGQVAVAA